MTDNSIEPPGRAGRCGIGWHEKRDRRLALPAAEFCCWVVVLLAPVLRWIKGAAVTDDQFYIQVATVTMALFAATGLRFLNWRRGKNVNR